MNVMLRNHHTLHHWYDFIIFVSRRARIWQVMICVIPMRHPSIATLLKHCTLNMTHCDNGFPLNLIILVRSLERLINLRGAPSGKFAWRISHHNMLLWLIIWACHNFDLIKRYGNISYICEWFIIKLGIMMRGISGCKLLLIGCGRTGMMLISSIHG